MLTLLTNVVARPRGRVRSVPPLTGLTMTVICAACVGTSTQLRSVSQADLQGEQLKQQQLVIKSEIVDQQRVENVGYPLLKAALPLCGPASTGTRPGVRFANVHSFNKQYQAAAYALGFTDTLTVVAITKGSAAERGGVHVGDRIVGIGETTVTPGKNAMELAMTALGRSRNVDDGVPLTVRHGSLSLSTTSAPAVMPISPPSSHTPVSVRLPVDTLCSYGLAAVKNDMLNAFADGQAVYVTNSMLRFAGTDDDLAVVLAHEIAHNAMKHMDAKKKNAALGGLFGAILDIAAATQGVNTQGTFSNDFAAMGAQVFSQDFEREADYVGMYVLARGGRPFASAADFWRRMAQESPGSIKFASSHPTTAERFLRLDQAAKEIQQKIAGLERLMPDLKKP